MLVRTIPLALLAAWWSATAISAQPMVPEELVPSVTVVGTGEAEGRPDMAHFTVGVITEAPTAAEALSANSEAMNRLMAALEEHEIEERDIQTVQFDISPQFRHDAPPRRPLPRRELQLQQEPADEEQPVTRRQPQPRQERQLRETPQFQEAPQVWDEPQDQHEPRIVGYQVNNQVRVRVRDLERLGEILDAVVRQQANRLHSVGFAIDDPEALEDEARQRAMASARRKAELYAQAADATLGRVLLIQEQVMGIPRPMAPQVMRTMAVEAAVPIAPGEMTVSAQVTVTYRLEEREEEPDEEDEEDGEAAEG